jgi:hypothetical protein
MPVAAPAEGQVTMRRALLLLLLALAAACGGSPKF